MNRHRNTLLIATIGLAAVTAESAAQQRRDERVVDLASVRRTTTDPVDWSGRSNLLTGAADSASLQTTAIPSVSGHRPEQLGTYVVMGALIGGVGTVALLAYALESSNSECMCGPIVFLPVIAVGTVVGAGMGAIVYAISH